MKLFKNNKLFLVVGFLILTAGVFGLYKFVLAYSVVAPQDANGTVTLSISGGVSGDTVLYNWETNVYDTDCDMIGPREGSFSYPQTVTLSIPMWPSVLRLKNPSGCSLV